MPLKNNTRSLKEWAAFTYPAHDHVVDIERRSGETWEWRTSVITGAQVPDDIREGLCGVQTLIRREHQVTRRDGAHRVEVRYAVSSRLLTAQEAERTGAVTGASRIEAIIAGMSCCTRMRVGCEQVHRDGRCSMA